MLLSFSIFSVSLSFAEPSYATMTFSNETTSTISSSLTFSADGLSKAEYFMDYVLGKVFKNKLSETLIANIELSF